MDGWMDQRKDFQFEFQLAALGTEQLLKERVDEK